jgi:hypothetical protein
VRFTDASSVLYVLLIRLIHLSFLYYARIAKQTFCKSVIFSFDPFVFSLSNYHVQAFRLLFRHRIKLCLVKTLRPVVEQRVRLLLHRHFRFARGEDSVTKRRAETIYRKTGLFPL